MTTNKPITSTPMTEQEIDALRNDNQSWTTNMAVVWRLIATIDQLRSLITSVAPPGYVVTPNAGGFNCTSADKTVEVYGHTQEEAILRMTIAWYAQRAKLATSPKQVMYEDGRCQVCGWPLAKTVEDGCIPESCSMRAREGSEEWYRLKERREWLALMREQMKEKAE